MSRNSCNDFFHAKESFVQVSIYPFAKPSTIHLLINICHMETSAMLSTLHKRNKFRNRPHMMILMLNQHFSGTVSISTTLITTPLGPYIYNFLPETIKNASFFKRCMGLSLFNLLCSSLMALLRIFVDRNYKDVVVFATIALVRGAQGCGVGVMYVLVQVRIRSVFY